MGFFGLFFLARSDQPLAGLASVARVGRDCGENVYPGGWRLGQIHYSHEPYDAEILAAGLVADTGAPALAMYVFDNDFGDAYVDSPNQTRHWFFLDTQSALAMYEPWDEAPDPPSDQETVECLMRWAAEAQLPASPDRLLAALSVPPGPFGEGVIGLISALGVSVPEHDDD